MKKIVFVLFAFSISLSAQVSIVDSLEIQNLEEVIVSSIRVKENIPIAFNNVSKEEISKRNLGQDTTILIVIRNPYDLLNSIYVQNFSILICIHNLT